MQQFALALWVLTIAAADGQLANLSASIESCSGYIKRKGGKFGHVNKSYTTLGSTIRQAASVS